MRFNPLRTDSAAPAAQGPALLAVTPPRTGQRTLLGVENLLGSIAAPEPFALELAGRRARASGLLRPLPRATRSVRGQIGGPLPPGPGARASRPSATRCASGRMSRPGRSRSAPRVPTTRRLRVFRDQDLLDPWLRPAARPWSGRFPG